MTTVGLLGVGRMGSAMGHALRDAGFDLVVWNRTPDAARALADRIGCTPVDRPRDVAAAADVWSRCSPTAKRSMPSTAAPTA